jgi:hypothetical protein
LSAWFSSKRVLFFQENSILRSATIINSFVPALEKWLEGGYTAADGVLEFLIRSTTEKTRGRHVMKRNATLIQRILFGVFLVLLSVFFYALHYAIFRDAHHIFIYLVGDIAFVFIEVLLVTLIIHQVLSERERRSLLNKLNMVIGAFFSEVGTPLLRYFVGFDAAGKSLSKELLIDTDWSGEHFSEVAKTLKRRDPVIDSKAGDLPGLRDFLAGERGFLVRLLENPNLLEHERFTELLWAVFHLAEELSHRKTVEGLPDSDYKHLAGDIRRAYRLLLREWVFYMEHLKNDYPYLFSLAVRTNPLNPNASPEVK